MKISEIAFWANKLYFDACENIRGTVLPENVDFDAYVYFELVFVPDHVDFFTKSKKLESQKNRINEFRKYLHFTKPSDLNVLESKQADAVGLSAVCEYLNQNDFTSHVRWNYRN
jgi:hypothetical protein